MDVDLERHAREQFLDAGDAAGHAPRGEAAADVVLMGVSHQRAGEPHAVGLGGVDDRVDLPRGIHHDALAGHRVADEIDEVLHRPQLELLEIDSRLGHGVSCYSGRRARSRKGAGATRC